MQPKARPQPGKMQMGENTFNHLKTQVMKIEIYAPETPAQGYRIFADGKKVSNSRANLRPSEFDENELLFLLGEKQFEKFETGKFEFNVPAYMIGIISGNFNPTTQHINKLSLEWEEL